MSHMGVHDAPQWLTSAFVRSCTAAGATAPRQQIETAASRLLERWGDESRYHHNVRHLVDVLAKVDQLAEETHHPELVRLAAWYHGAIFSSAPASAYAQRGGEDEVSSAELAAEELSALGIPAASVTIVHDIIRGLARHRDAVDVDTQALCDAELATLAVEPQKYAEYRRSVRREYAHIPMRDYLSSRIAILGKLLARKRLFASPLGQPWEEPARQNLSAELKRLKDELAHLPADGDGGLASEAATTELPVVPPPARNGTTGGLRRVQATTSTNVAPAAPAGATTAGIPAVRPDGAAAAAQGPGTGEVPVVPRESVIRRIEKTPGRTSEKPVLPGRS
jgi:predicted metal-dependent HD superfamily phosphohydrolase